MNIKLHEIELGIKDLEAGMSFFHSLLGLPVSVDQPSLKVLDPGIGSLDLNISHHLPEKEIVLSFLCDNIEEMIKNLSQRGIPFSGPASSHLGMKSISFTGPAGHLIRINQATANSPAWLQQQL